ncbi:hypothetical protein BGZ80_010710 [Entomortierella chlamydospora]|uniref:non-specific serine/threonine protein kinase n=1 Tax=Entomortierella chlamydospora TaxID=101097 RepID=A0A9P6MUC8_9FUNG|nr:hypothetical protein BGZ79_000346 [Entomortierella chlamydospora]KAG0014002.1 hypothetical protein BGZ80_010710 [Entomortierella chlamydospora]
MNVVGLNMPQQGTILPGTTIQLGRFTVVIDRYIAEGGFAHVYLASLISGGGIPVVVKRIAVADKERLAIVQKEIDTMKCLGKHKNIVEYMDSCMGKLEGGGYEVLILMEYCGGGPVIDLMNRRLQHRLTEPEILKIFSNVCEAVAYLHYCNPPILHRDIKVENILLSNNDYKLCDFGSATTNILRGDNIPRNVKDIQLLEEEINNHTTLQYRAPEMLDLYMKKGIDEKIDIWALGVLLYKLCYYTTPFEEQGQLAILNVRYTIPEHPVFSPGLIGLFKSMLKEDPRQRPNIYQVMKATSSLRGLPCPIQNKYPDTPLPTAQEIQPSATANIFSSATVTRPVDALPSIEPMRRGRPTRPQAGAAPPIQGNDNSFQSPPPQSDFSSGFDDSFGQFSQTTDPASQFSKITPAGDAFDFGNSAFDSGIKSDSKRFTLDFESGGDEFGFNFSNSGSKDSTSRPRPPSFTASDLQPSNVYPNTKSAMPAQLSGTNNANYLAAKPTADDLFFGSSADKTSRPTTPSSFGSFQQTPVGLSSPPSIVGSQSSGMGKPLLPTRPGVQQPTPAPRLNASYQSNTTVSSQSNKGVYNDSTGSSKIGLSANTSPVSSSSGVFAHGLGSTNSTEKSNGGINALGQTMTTVESLELLQRRQMEQFGRFLDSNNSANPQNTQGKAKILDPSKTLDGLKSQSVSSRTVANQGPTGTSAVSPPAIAPRPQVSSSSIGASIVPGSATELPPLDRKALAQRDMDTELKLIQLQQKEFERQQQELFALQRQEMEEQQRQHRQQQEQLQRQQQQQIQLQHEKWQERKRMLTEQEQLTQKQLVQQKDLERQHEIQKQQQLQEQQQQQQHSFPEVSDLASSMASVSLNTNPATVASSSNPYRRSVLNSGNALQSPVSGSNAGNVDHFTSHTGAHDSNYSTPITSPSASFQSSFSSGPQAISGSELSSTKAAIAPSVPVKAARRTGVNGTDSSSTTPTTPVASAAGSPTKARRASINMNLPPGQKPELLPKPTRFRMKDGTGTLVAGEEEAFKKRFPSADVDEDLIQFTSTSTTTATARTDSSQYMSPSQRARANFNTAHDEEEEEEEETLVRSRRRQYNSPAPSSPASNGPTQKQDSADEPSTPVESVRDRVLRMNRAGRVN